MAISSYYLVPPLPEGLENLGEMALDLRWSWSHATDILWERIDPEIWALTRNPWLILQTVSTARLDALADDPSFLSLANQHFEAHRQTLEGKTWFQKAHSDSPLTVAYFSMEFGLSEALPIYSGGLGILAGDNLKTASDLGVPLMGIGLLYRQGYFRQCLDASGGQMEFYPYNEAGQLPIMPVRDEGGEWLRVELDFPGRRLRLRPWKAKVGRVNLYLLDGNDPANSPADQGITSELYGGGSELRLQQEIVLGVGGWRLLRKLGIEASVCHLNEGHAAMAVLERARAFMEDNGKPFDVALAATRAGNIFTTHTPVDAGFDRFSPALISRYLGSYAGQLGISLEDLLALGRRDPSNVEEPFNMAYLAMRGTNRTNGVSRLHGEVSRRIFQVLFNRWPRHEIPVTHITNGVHMPSWDSEFADKLWTRACGKARWLGTMDTIEKDFKKLSDETLWTFRNEGRRQLIDYARKRLARQLGAAGASAENIRKAGQILDPDVLTVGFARRFASYKRPNLLLHDGDRLIRLMNHPKRPMQIIISGKAHPRDEAGKDLIRAWIKFIRRPEVRPRMIFLEDYDMVLAEQMVQGVDLWINTPRRPWEACGTSGMKVLINGGINLSELDGWWAEAYRPEAGWALGDGKEHGDDLAWDAYEAEQLYNLLEDEVIPCFYERDVNAIPHVWIARMRMSMAELTPRFSTNRMLREYVETLYLPAFKGFHERSEDGADKAVRLCRWNNSLETHWHRMRFGNAKLQKEGSHYTFSVPVYLDDLDPGSVHVQLYAEPNGTEKPEIHLMERNVTLPGTVNGYLYSVRIEARRSANDYTPRIIPAFEDASIPMEAQQILWYK
jgi:starch phosphorylase